MLPSSALASQKLREDTGTKVDLVFLPDGHKSFTYVTPPKTGVYAEISDTTRGRHGAIRIHSTETIVTPYDRVVHAGIESPMMYCYVEAQSVHAGARERRCHARPQLLHFAMIYVCV